MQFVENALLESDLIQTFVTISETGSFTAAAKRVFRTPSAVSMQMKKLETQLGRPLFVRHPRHVTLTSDGEAFLVYGRDILRLNQEALSRFRIPQLEGRVRFGAPDDFGTRFLPQILSRFASTHPFVEVDVSLLTTVNLTQQLDSGQLDLTLVVAMQAEATAGKMVFLEPLVWAGPREGRAHEQRPVPVALSAPGCPWRAAALKSLEELNVPYRIAYTSETGAGQLAAVEADLAIAPMPASLMMAAHQKLTAKDGFRQIGTYQLRLLEARKLSSASRAFSAHVHESLKQIGQMGGP